MSRALDLLHRALDEAREPRTIFIRNDDAGWSAPALDRLLAVAADTGVTIDLAVIPAALTESEAARLARFARNTGAARAHQHGYAHVNHAETGRKCEFGADRTADHQRRDIRFGRERLTDFLGDIVDPIFTPPWNRCTQETVDALEAEGLAALSRNTTASALDLRSLVEVPITADWGKADADPDICLAAIARQIAAGARAIGLMTHHAALSEQSLAALAALFRLLKNHPNARLTTMGAILQTLRRESAASATENLA